MKIGVERNIVVLPVIVVDGSHFNLLIGVNWTKKARAEFNFEKNQLIIGGETIMLQSHPKYRVHLAEQKYKVYSNINTVIETGV